LRLLFDANISYKLVEVLADLFPDSSHVSLPGLGRTRDRGVWEHAIEHGFTIVSKDEDFHQMALLEGPPPKVIWVRPGNCSTADIERALRESADTSRRSGSRKRLRSWCLSHEAAELAAGADLLTIARPT
jgi:predicted nuclease of predicted toxin-antitoxin system